ncbi:hypothetical protein RhiirC2_798934 [Rhizophagus irregularis]|uniref:Protein kinase domain-containing protein n=1 Tax=Rhizophagus irregularis TaxID=588596 RepID=A0A2N1M5V2_9GLOM|nr:hypothetical protein RhiirC2_798934 [Rhizophagus irregularis]
MCSIIKAGRLFNEYLSKLIEALELPEHDFHRNSVIQTELDNFANEPDLKVNVEYGDLFAYFQVNHRSLNLLKDWRDKIKLAWEITQGIKYLHNQKILHLDLRTETSSDIYSLGLLFWEIAWCKAGNLPFKKVSIKNLYNHLQKNNQETMPKLPIEYQR